MILDTIIKRPYVFAFLLSYLFLASTSKGWAKTILFLVWGYLIAWTSEALSIRTGFPYGWYFYIYENLQGEWMNYGVPVWDSLSYVFMCYAGMSLAELVFTGQFERVALVGRPAARTLWSRAGRNQRQDPFKLNMVRACAASFFVVILDIIIDPIAHLGDKWFLGKIYYYPHPGWYFNIPLSNFIGWFFVGIVIIGGFYAIDHFWSSLRGEQRRSNPEINDGLPRTFGARNDGGFITTYGGTLLYFGIFFFNFLITLWIQEWFLALLALAWISIPATCLYRSTRSKITETP